MKRTAIVTAIPLLLLLASACSTKGGYNPVPGAVRVDPGARFSVGQITDETGFAFPADAEDKLVPEEAMAMALTKALQARGVLGDGMTAAGGGNEGREDPEGGLEAPDGGREAPDAGQWAVDVKLVKYAPGNAFHRWLLPGAGKTILGVVASVKDREGRVAATIPVERSIGFGGAFTVKAWSYVFDEVAEEIADYLADPEKRAGRGS
ncbi:MAG: DUF4410 domain-containing protein [Deltaproteobacteria bacterium]|nr:DUF4410 domain-containing protein [Deltaproteobacteria bacterium]